MALLMEQVQIVPFADAPIVNFATADVVSDRVSLENYAKAMLVCTKNAGSVTDELDFIFLQCTAASGGTTKAIPVGQVRIKSANAGVFTETLISPAANTYSTTALAEVAVVIEFEFDAASLDSANGFKFLQATVTDVGDGASNGTLFWALSGSRYQPPVSALA